MSDTRAQSPPKHVSSESASYHRHGKDWFLIQALRRFVQHPTGGLGMVIVSTYILAGVLLPRTMHIDPLAMPPAQELKSPSSAHPFGTDEFGRDILSRTIYGVQTSLMVATEAVLLAGGPGIASGLATGYLGGLTDTIFMRLLDGILAFPPLLMAITLATILGPGPHNAALTLGVLGLPMFSRITRAKVLIEREKEYVLAARSYGVRTLRIIWKHVLPNIFPPILVQITLAMGYAVLLEAGLSFLGLGIQPPFPSLGNMLAESQQYFYQAWWYPLFPGAVLSGLLLGLNWVSEALSASLDPRTRSV